jgi:hypothetical protein
MLRDLVEIDELSGEQKGIYRIKLNREGARSETLTIDDYIPCSRRTGFPLFMSGREGNRWSHLVIKAYAKSRGGYENLRKSSPIDIIRDIVGRPVAIYDMSIESEGTCGSHLFKMLQNRKNILAMMGEAADEADHEEGLLMRPNAPAPGHLYPITQVKDVCGHRVL